MNRLNWSIFGFGVVFTIMIMLLVSQLFPILRISNDTTTPGELVKLFPLISLEIILIYFFRIALVERKSAKAQLLQIKLRRTLCKFIGNYSKHAKAIKDNSEPTLDKFENLIFSAIQADPDKLPNTFDGMDQIGNLLKTLKNK